jgi:hypothetical protein
LVNGMRPSGRLPRQKSFPATSKAMPIHRQVVGRPKRPSGWMVWRPVGNADPPKSKQGLLGYVARFVVVKPEPTDEAKQLLAVLGVNVLHDLNRAAVSWVAFGHG